MASSFMLSIRFCSGGASDCSIQLRSRTTIGQAIGQPGLCRFAIASRATGFLVITLQALGQIQVGDEAHVRLVDPHAEGDRSHHDETLLAQEALLVRATRLGIHSGVVWQCMEPLLGQPLGGLFDLLARQAVDDSRLSAMACHEGQQLARALSFSTTR